MCDIEALDLVECIDNDPKLPESRIMPEKGRLYTIDSVRRLADVDSVRLIELDPECRRGGPCACGECGWDARRFRRVYRPERESVASLLQPQFPTLPFNARRAA